MSRKVPEEQHKNTLIPIRDSGFDVRRIRSLDTVEMKPQQEFKEDTTVPDSGAKKKENL